METEFPSGNSVSSPQNVKAILSANGKWSIDENGKLVVGEIETERLKVETGVTTQDRTTGDYYCVFVDNGAVRSEKGTCGENAPQSTPPPPPGPAPGPTPLQEEPASTTTATQPSPEATAGEASAPQ